MARAIRGVEFQEDNVQRIERKAFWLEMVVGVEQSNKKIQQEKTVT
jgi:hypothetical protein